MTLRYLLDTNVAIDALRRRPSLRSRFVAESGRVAVSAITRFELEYGALRSANPATTRIAMETLLQFIPVLDFDDAAADRAAEVRAALSAAGTPIGAYDTLIAGHALARGLTLVTNNTREFSRVPGLQVENWTGDAPGAL